MSDVIELMPKEVRAEHRAKIAEEFADFRRGLDDLVSRMYTDHFTDELKRSPEYATIVEAADKLKQTILEMYKP